MDFPSLLGALRWYKFVLVSGNDISSYSSLSGERVWGRGSSDDKAGLIGILSTIETLLEKGFKPTRSVVAAFGFDEEASGVYVRFIHFGT